MRPERELLPNWEARNRFGRLHPRLEIGAEGLVLGAGTMLAKTATDARGNPHLAVEEPRVVALLATAYGKPVAPYVVARMRRAAELWNEDEKALAHIHLAHANLPPCGEDETRRLFLAEECLSEGITPAELTKGQGYVSALLALLKYNPDEQRVPPGSGRESGEWTSGDGGGAGSTPFVERAEARVAGATMSDANPAGIVPGAQYAQLNPVPKFSEVTMDKIIRIHGPDASIKKGAFNAEYANADKIRGLIKGAWEKATPMDVAASYKGRVIIVGAVFDLDPQTGEKIPYPIGRSAALNTPSKITNTYVVILDPENNVVDCYPINPADHINPRDE